MHVYIPYMCTLYRHPSGGLDHTVRPARRPQGVHTQSWLVWVNISHVYVCAHCMYACIPYMTCLLIHILYYVQHHIIYYYITPYFRSYRPRHQLPRPCPIIPTTCKNNTNTLTYILHYTHILFIPLHAPTPLSLSPDL